MSVEFWSPRYLSDALELLDRSSDSVCISAGLTHILRFYTKFPDKSPDSLDGVIHIGDIPSLGECREETGKYSLGATTRFLDIQNDRFIAQHCAAIWDAARISSTPQIRNRRTVGGELAWGSFHSALIASLMAFDAEVRIRRAARSGEVAFEETIDLFHFYKKENLKRVNHKARSLESRAADLGPRDLLVKACIPETAFRKPGHFSFVRTLTPKISTENPGVVVAVRGQAQNGQLVRAQFVVAGPWIRTLREEIPLEGVRLRPNEFFEKLYNFCDRFPFENYRMAGPSGKQLSLMIFGLMKEGFSSFLGYQS